MKRIGVFAALAAALALATPAWAHKDGLDARGIVVEVSANRIVLNTTDGETKSFAVSERTRIHRGKAPASIADVAKGEKAIVHAERSKSGDPLATSIKLGATPQQRR